MITVCPWSLWRLLKQIQDLHTGFAVQRAGWLICKQDGGVIDKSARNRHALLLSTRELTGGVVDPVGKPNSIESLHCELMPFLSGKPCISQWQHDIFQGTGTCQQVELLKDKPNLAPADFCEL